MVVLANPGQYRAYQAGLACLGSRIQLSRSSLSGLNQSRFGLAMRGKGETALLINGTVPSLLEDHKGCVHPVKGRKLLVNAYVL
jgi:hypothetical protein